MDCFAIARNDDPRDRGELDTRFGGYDDRNWAMDHPAW
jgi:hypothetical protein